MKNTFARLFLIPFLYCTNANADFTGTVKQVVCHVQEISSVCHVSVNGSPTQPACVAQDWKYSFDGTTDEGKNILSILLAAQMSKQAVTIGGKGTCLLIGGTEDLRHVYITTQ
jgi:hypothetical protein